MNTPEETRTARIPDEPEMKQTEVWPGIEERAVAVQPSGTARTSHFVRLKNYLMIPSSLKINIGDRLFGRITRIPVCLP